MNRPESPDFTTLHGQLQIETPLGAFLGAQRIALLEAIGQQGSIARAAKVVALSYKAAWEAVDDMNNLASQPLVQRFTGGPRGGGTTLTAYGQGLISFFRALEQEHQAAVARLSGVLHGGQAADVADFRRLLNRFAMQSSARNQFVGTVEVLHADGVEARVQLRIAPGLLVAAIVAAESVERMGLCVGVEAHALVKSSSVMIASSEAKVQISASNYFAGRVLSLLRGPVNSEVIVQLPAAHLQIAAIVTDDSVQRLGLVAGLEVAAFFKASSVMLALAC